MSEVTTGHDPMSERKFAGTLFIALILAALIVAFFSLAVGQKTSLNSLKSSSQTETPTNAMAPSR